MTSVEEGLIDNDVLECQEDEKVEDPLADIRDSKTAWLVCFCAVIDQLFITGLINVFGVFFIEFIKEFGTSKGKAAWLGSLTYGLMKLFAPLVGAFVRKYTNRVSMVIGSAFCAVSVFSTSFVTNVNLMFVTFPLLFGIGTSLVINPSMVIASGYFHKHLGLATGLVCAGSSIGSVTLAPLCQSMVDSIGWRMTFRYLTCVYVSLCLLNLLVKPLPRGSVTPIDTISQPVVRGLIEDLKLWKNRVFVLWATATAFVMFGYYIPCVHMISYAMGEGIPADTAAYLLMAMGGSTTVGRLLSGKIVQSGFMNRLHLHQLTMIITGTAFMILPSVKTFPGLLTYVIITGLVDGCYIVLLPILTCALIGADKAVVAWCFMSGFSSLTFTLGPPVSGFLCDLTGTYDIAFHIAGIPVILGAVILFFVPWAQRTARTTNVMRVLSKELEQPWDKSHSPDPGSSEETIHIPIPETATVPQSVAPRLIDPQQRIFCPGGSREFMYYPATDANDKQTQTVGSAPGISIVQCETESCLQDEDTSTTLHHSAPVFEAFRQLQGGEVISIPRRDDFFIDGYLEELRRAMHTSQTSTLYPNPVCPSLSPHVMSPVQPRPFQVTSQAVSSVTSSVDQLIQEHINLFLADLASRRASGLSTSSGISQSMSRTQRANTDNSLSSNTSSSISRTSAGHTAGHNAPPTLQNPRQCGSRASCQHTVGANQSVLDSTSRCGTQQHALASISQVSDASHDTVGSHSIGRSSTASNTSTGPKELDVFSHLFNDDN